MNILNIAGYLFIPLSPSDLHALRDEFATCSHALNLKGTILLAPEGVNISLAGNEESIRLFEQALKKDVRFTDMLFHESHSDFVPFKKMKIKIKKEIITFRQPSANPLEARAKIISPEEFKSWYESNQTMTVLDTRNEFEYQHGTFKDAVNLHLNHFDELPTAISTIDREKPVVMFCTGGVRCEKAAIYMQQQGFKDVRQLDGGILGYFNQVGGAHYQGSCFVFDERRTVTPSMFYCADAG